MFSGPQHKSCQSCAYSPNVASRRIQKLLGNVFETENEVFYGKHEL